MSNDLNFLNTYVEVVNENVASIIKQNFVFQTQIKMMEIKLAQMEDAVRRADELTVANRDLQQKVNDLNNLTSTFKNVNEDKGRLQISLNETSQVKNQLQADLNAAEQEIARLKNQVNEIDDLRKENAAFKKKLGIKEEKPKQDKPAEKPEQELKATAGTF